MTTVTKEKKAELAKKFGANPKDTGNPAVQVALLTERINDLAPHFKTHEHDYHSNRGLLKMIGKRRSLLKFIQKKDETKYQSVIKELNLRK